MFSLKNSWVVWTVWAGQILLEDVVAVWRHPLPGGPHPAAKGPDKFGVDSFANALQNNQTFLVVISHHPQDHLLQRVLGKDYADAGVHVGHREVCCCGG
jgi:hypothetical protein